MPFDWAEELDLLKPRNSPAKQLQMLHHAACMSSIND
jgi:hypothetical protein